MSVREKLCELYPSGLVLGGSYGIVGSLGLTVEWINADGNKQQEIFKEDEEVSIIKHELHRVEISARGKIAIIGTTFLKGLRTTKITNNETT